MPPLGIAAPDGIALGEVRERDPWSLDATSLLSGGARPSTASALDGSPSEEVGLRLVLSLSVIKCMLAGRFGEMQIENETGS